MKFIFEYDSDTKQVRASVKDSVITDDNGDAAFVPPGMPLEAMPYATCKVFVDASKALAATVAKALKTAPVLEPKKDEEEEEPSTVVTVDPGDEDDEEKDGEDPDEGDDPDVDAEEDDWEEDLDPDADSDDDEDDEE